MSLFSDQKRNSTDADSYADRGICRYKQKEFKLAIEDFMTCVAVRPSDSARGQFLLAQTFYHVGYLQAASDTLKQSKTTG